MKRTLKFSLAALLFLSITSCKKESASSSSNNPPTSCNQAPFRVGTTYTYSGGTPTTTSTITATKDTLIAGTTYFNMQGTSGTTTQRSYIAVDASGNVLQWVPSLGDVPANTMIYVKTGEAVNATWNYTFNGVSNPTLVKHKYTFTILSKSETFTLNGVTYSNGIKVRQLYQPEVSGISTGNIEFTTTYFCGLGTAVTTQGATVLRTLTGYTY